MLSSRTTAISEEEEKEENIASLRKTQAALEFGLDWRTLPHLHHHILKAVEITS